MAQKILTYKWPVIDHHSTRWLFSGGGWIGPGRATLNGARQVHGLLQNPKFAVSDGLVHLETGDNVAGNLVVYRRSFKHAQSWWCMISWKWSRLLIFDDLGEGCDDWRSNAVLNPFWRAKRRSTGRSGNQKLMCCFGEKSFHEGTRFGCSRVAGWHTRCDDLPPPWS